MKQARQWDMRRKSTYPTAFETFEQPSGAAVLSKV